MVMASPAKKTKLCYSIFNEESFIDSIMDIKRSRKMCCGKGCLLKVSEGSIRSHAMLLAFYFSLDPPDIRNRVYRSFVMSCYLLHVNESGNHSQFCIPSSGVSLCRETWLLLMNLSKSTYTRWRDLSVPTRCVLPAPHGLAGAVANAAKPAVKAAVRQYLRDVAEADGHPCPVACRQADQRRIEEEQSEETILWLPPRYSKNMMHVEYISFQTDSTSFISRTNFFKIMEKEMPYVRVSKRARGLCDICFMYKDSVSKSSDNMLTDKAREWNEHIERADTTRHIYRTSLRDARELQLCYRQAD